MTSAELKTLCGKLKDDDLIVTTELLEEISEAFCFAHKIDVEFIVEVNQFVNLLHKKLSKTGYYQEIKKKYV